MRHFIKCTNYKECIKHQKQLFKKDFNWASGLGLLEFDNYHFPLYLIADDKTGHIHWDEIWRTESDPSFKREIRKNKLEKLQNCDNN